MRGLILDLDQTLVDSQCIELFRRSRQWSLVYQKIPTILAYEGVDKILSLTKDKGIKISIVSSSPSSYVNRVIRHFGWNFDATVCYHDTSSHKPHPAPFIEAAHRLKIEERDCWAVGDHPNDIIAAKNAGIYSVGALWGSLDKEALRREKPDLICDTISSLYKEINRTIRIL